MEKRSSRLHNSIINIGTTGIVYVFTMAMAMLVRSFLNRILGQTYVGLNGVLTSVITSFSIADLGVDSVFVFLMYKPLAQRDSQEITNLMALFKRVYVIIGTIFLTVGIVAIPFLEYLIGKQAMGIPHIRLIYFLFLLNTGLSYFFAAFRIILNADQKFYVIARITFLVTMAINVLQMIFLLILKSFIMYALLLVISTVLINVIVGIVANQRYRLSERRLNRRAGKVKLHFKNKDTFGILIRNTIGGLSNKLGGIVVYASDNILLANFETLKVVGMYSNYILITQGISSLLSKVISSITASVGNLGAEDDKERNYSVYITLTFIINILTFLVLVPLLICFSVFIKLWVGKQNVLPTLPVILISINCILQLIRFPALTFIDAFGLQWKQKWKSVVEALVNIVVSLFLLWFFKLGLVGVLLGTLCSNLLVVNWYEPYVVLKEVGQKRYKEYISQVTPFILLFIIGILFSNYILESGWLGFSVIKTAFLVIVVEVIQLLLVVILFRKNSSMVYLIRVLQTYLNKKRSN